MDPHTRGRRAQQRDVGAANSWYLRRSALVETPRDVGQLRIVRERTAIDGQVTRESGAAWKNPQAAFIRISESMKKGRVSQMTIINRSIIMCPVCGSHGSMLRHDVRASLIYSCGKCTHEWQLEPPAVGPQNDLPRTKCPPSDAPSKRGRPQRW